MYRYCYGLLRRYVAEWAEYRFGSRYRWFERFQASVSEEKLEQCATDKKKDVFKVAAAIQEEIGALEEGHSAPWLYDAVCPVSVTGSELPGRVGQLLVVVSPDWTASSGVLHLYERASPGSDWRLRTSGIPVVLGASGLGWGRGIHPISYTKSALRRGVPVKVEGDLRSPAGMFTVGDLLGRRRPSGARLPFHETEADLVCDDSPESSRYNRYYRAAGQLARCERGERACPERLRRTDSLYDLFLWVNHNRYGAVRDAGSCIFLHIWPGPGTHTSGCTAMDKRALTDIARWLVPDRLPVLVQLPIAEYAHVQRAWGLPTLPSDSGRTPRTVP